MPLRGGAFRIRQAGWITAGATLATRGVGDMSQSIDQERIYEELRRRAVAEFGEERAVELESYLRTAAQQIYDVEGAEVHPDLEPLFQE